MSKSEQARQARAAAAQEVGIMPLLDKPTLSIEEVAVVIGITVTGVQKRLKVGAIDKARGVKVSNGKHSVGRKRWAFPADYIWALRGARHGDAPEIVARVFAAMSEVTG